MIAIRHAWFVATIFAMQAVLLGAAPPCACEPPVQASEAVQCCQDDAHTCCTVSQRAEEKTDPATVTGTSTVQFVATPTGTVRPRIVQSQPTLLKLTAQPHPTGLWSEFIRAERAPPLS